MSKDRQYRTIKKLALGCALVAIVLVVIITALLRGGQEMDPTMKAQLESANASYHQGRFREAQAVYTRIKQGDPENVSVLERLGTIALWQNRPEEAERYFKEAIAHASGLQQFWPFNIQRKASLAMTYYRMDNFPEAERLFKEAVGPVAIGPFRDLKAMGEQFALFDQETPYIVEGPEESRIDFVVTDPLPVIEVSVNGGEPVHFLIDTGGAEVILDSVLAREVGAEIAGTITGEFAGSQKATVELGRIDSIKVGEFVVKNVPVHTLSLDTSTDSFLSTLVGGLDIQGVIGTRLLMHFISTIDYVNGTLILRRTTDANLETLEETTNLTGTRVIPFWLIQTHYIVAWGTVNGGEPMLFFVDTGLEGKSFTALESVLQEAGVSVDWTKDYETFGGGGKYRRVDITIDRLTLGSGTNEVVKHAVPGVVDEKPGPVLGDALGFRIGGLISHQFFRDYALTLDFIGMRLVLQEKGISS